MFMILAPDFSRAEMAGAITLFRGNVSITSKKGVSVKAKVGQKITPTDVITTGEDGRIKIVMSDKSIIQVGPSTMVGLQRYTLEKAKDDTQVLIELIYGTVRATIEKKYDWDKSKFQIRSPAAVVGVRGTDFMVSHDAKEKLTKVITFEGIVAVSKITPEKELNNPVMVEAGKITTVVVGAESMASKELPALEIENLNQRSMVDPNDFSKKEPTATPIPEDKSKTPVRHQGSGGASQ
jgi:hypothetical protein